MRIYSLVIVDIVLVILIKSYLLVFSVSSVVNPTISNLDMATQIKLPNLGENIESGDVLSILVSEGDTVKADQDLARSRNRQGDDADPQPGGRQDHQDPGVAKATRSRSARRSWRSKRPRPKRKPAKKKSEAAQGRKSQSAPRSKEAEPEEPEPEEVEERAEDADVEGGDVEADEEPKPSKPETKKPKRAKPKSRTRKSRTAARRRRQRPSPRKRRRSGEAIDDVPGDGHASAAAGPAVRRLARQLGVELRRVRPTGAGGRITAEDVRAHVRETNEQVAATMPRGVTPPGSPDTDDFGGVRIEKMSRMRQTIARNMIQSYTTIPQLTNFDDVDVTELEDMREQSKADYADRGIKLTTHAVSDQGRRLVAQAASDAQRLGRHGEQPDHLQGIREHRHRGRHRARPGGAGAARRRPQEHLADRLRDRRAGHHGPRRQVRPRHPARRHVHDQQPGLGRRHVLDADHQPAASGDPARRPHAAWCRRSSTTSSSRG